MNLVSWIVFGLLIGVIAHLFDKSPSISNFLGAVILGILGAILGGFIASLVFNVDIIEFDFSALVVSVLASFIVLFGQRAVSKTSN